MEVGVAAPWANIRTEIPLFLDPYASLLSPNLLVRVAVVVVNEKLMGNHQLELAESMADRGYVLRPCHRDT